MAATYNQSMLNKARKDKFLMVLTPSKFLRDKINNLERGNDTINLDSFQFSVFGIDVPDITIPQVETSYGAQVLKVTSYSRPSFNNVNVKFTVDNNYNNYWFIYSWMNLLNDDKTAIPNQGSYPPLLDDYSTTITIYGLDEYNKNKIKFEFHQVIPVKLGTIAYNYRDSGEVESSFEFSFFQLITNLL